MKSPNIYEQRLRITSNVPKRHRQFNLPLLFFLSAHFVKLAIYLFNFIDSYISIGKRSCKKLDPVIIIGGGVTILQVG
jgi:hypothetical protein